MFSYYGSKSKIVKKYDPPKYNQIIEPFCGSARYSCLYPENEVWLNDIYPPIYRIWKYLVQATANDIKSLPELVRGEDLRNHTQLSQSERDLLGFCVTSGDRTPRNIVTGWAARDNEIGRMKSRVLNIIGKISHWKITSIDYSKVKIGTRATYFIDPPYQHRKTDYAVNTSDEFRSTESYNTLAKYCRYRYGQIIVCEMSPANWLDFTPIGTQGGQRRGVCEVIKTFST